MTQLDDSNDAIRVSVQGGVIFIAQFDRGLSEEDTIVLYPDHVEAMLAALLAAKLQAQAQQATAAWDHGRFLRGERWFCMTCEQTAETTARKDCSCTCEDALNCILIDRNASLTPAQGVAYRRLGETLLARSFERLDAFVKCLASA